MIFTWWQRRTQQKLRSAAKRRPWQTRYRPELCGLEDRTLMSVVGSINFPGIAQRDAVEPPDTNLAAGPNQLVEVVNSSIAFYDKASRAQLSLQRLSDFFSSVRGAAANGFLVDPLVIFDEQIGRFVVSVLDVSDQDTSSFIDIAVSDSADATAGFSEMQRIETTEVDGTNQALWGDYPKVGRNAEALVYSLNMYRFPTDSGTFDHVQIITLDKATLVDRDANTLTKFQVDRTNNDFTMAAVNIHDPVAGGPMWFVEENNIDRSNLRVVRMDDVLSAFPLFNDFVVAVPAYAAPTPPVQPGGVSDDPGIDSRILNAISRGGSLVAAQNVGTGSHTVARWYQISVTGQVPFLVQSGDIVRGNGADTYYPAVEIGPDGDIGMTFIESSAREFESMYITGRKPGDPIGVMQTPQLIKAGEAVYQGSRTGDYSGICVDPGNFPNFWAATQFAQQTGGTAFNFGTWVVNFLLVGTEPTSLVSRSRTFIAQIYLDVLQRPVDPVGLAFWSSLVDQGVPRDQVVRAITRSVEYLSLTVNNFYRTLLGRNADPGGLNGFVNYLANGGNSDRVQALILSSPEYVARNGGSNNLLYVRSLYLNVLGRRADSTGEVYFTRLLAAGIPRVDVAFILVTSAEAKTRVVQNLYQRLLHRAADSVGLSVFVTALVRGSQAQQAIVTSDQPFGSRNEDVLAAIAGSLEYFGRQ